MVGRQHNNPRKAVILWVAALCFLLTAVVAANLLWARYFAMRQANDYRPFLTEAYREIELQDFITAMENVQRAMALAPANAQVYKTAGDVNYRFRHWQTAIVHYEKAIELGDGEEDTRAAMVWALVQIKRYDGAIRFGETAVAQGYRIPAMIRSLSEAYKRQGDLEDALPYFKQALEYYPDDLYLMANIRAAYEASGDKEKADEMESRIDVTQEKISQMAQGPK